MSGISPWLFFFSVALLLLAHVVRCYRQTLLFRKNMLPWRFDLLKGLALSYLVNVLVPWRAGDVVRVVYVAYRYRLRISYVAATVVAERLCDLLVLALLLALLLAGSLVPQHQFLALAATFAALGLLLVAFAFALPRWTTLRRWTWRLAAIFNDRWRFAVLDLAWTFSQLVTGGTLIRVNFLALTAAMWGAYFSAYAAFAASAGTSLLDVSAVLLGGPNKSLLRQLSEADAGDALPIFIFSALPVIGVLAYGSIRGSRQILDSLGLLRRYGLESLSMTRSITGEQFRDQGNYAAFLEAHFGGSNAIVSRLGLLAAPDVVVHKLLPGGSDAITAVVEVDGVLKIRKCASGASSDKLEEQAQWLRKNRSALPLAHVADDNRNGNVYCYDMPYIIAARDFYEVIHTSPLDESQELVANVVAQMHRFHLAHAAGQAPLELIDEYLLKKVVANADLVRAYGLTLFPQRQYRINGEDYDLDEWKVLFDLDWLRAQVACRDTAIIHGDLTIENIIVSTDMSHGWYAIDPNPANIFNTPLIDWAKLMQSLHLGYEGLNRGSECALQGGDLKLLLVRSNAYSILHAFLAQRLQEQVGAQRMREIAFHELVNYLRLTPYKIRHDPHKALTFFACISILLRRYLQGGVPMTKPFS
ncbi:MAG: flippase-like domain-containing protein [Proteobacteria bacterium]|nr:flippase-like domain-containing protein [Pseudomonadota bacterium]